MCGYPMVKKIPIYVCSFWHDPRTWQTDGQTDRPKNRQTPHDSIDRACLALRGTRIIYLSIYNSFQVIRTTIAKKSPFSRTPAFIFCLPWGSPCGNHAKRCMYPSIFNSFPVIRTASVKNRHFHVPQPTFLFPLETPLRLSRNVLHGWKDNSMLAKPLASCTYLSSIVSELYDA